MLRTARAPINIAILRLTALSKLPTQKTAAASKIMGFLPHISEIFPHIGAAAADASIYADPIHVYPAVDLNSAAIVGIATVTMVTSKAERKRA